ncbi:MAG TPA: ATP-binding protein [Sphingomicrobium sp.]|nr:ATP-binding protein [Sphingomicrobium sp.]
MNPRESNPERLNRSFRGDKAIVQAVEAARSFASSRRLIDEDRARLCIIVEELIANLYDHGGLGGGDEVELTLAAEQGAVRVTIVDPGKPFDPRNASETVSAEPGAGAGLALVRAWTEVLRYESTAAGNRLELLVPLRTRPE